MNKYAIFHINLTGHGEFLYVGIYGNTSEDALIAASRKVGSKIKAGETYFVTRINHDEYASLQYVHGGEQALFLYETPQPRVVPVGI